MSRIVLVSSNTMVDPYPVYPVGLAMIAFALSDSGHDVRQFDLLAENMSDLKFRNLLTSFQPDYVGLSIRNIDSTDHCLSGNDWYLSGDLKVMKLVREAAPGVPVILGGSGFSVMPEQILDYLGADYGIAGEGERAVCDLIDSLDKGQRKDTLTRVDISPRAGIESCKPLWDPSLVQFYMGRSAMLSIQTKRGCPHQCAYCTYPEIEGHSVRMKQADNVIDQIERVKNTYGVNTFYFTDSIFNDAQDKYLELAEALIRSDLRIRWAAFFRPQGVDTQKMQLLKRSGLYAVEAGGDAATNETLAGLNKHLTFDDIYEFNSCCANAEIPCAHYVIFGGPEETELTVKKGISNLDRLKNCIVFAFSGIRVFPGTSIERRAIEEGLLAKSESLLKPFYYFSPYISSDAMESMIERGFEGRRDRIFPPSQGLEMAKIMNGHGYYGLLWDRLIGFD